jgi:hypothetical protein
MFIELDISVLASKDGNCENREGGKTVAQIRCFDWTLIVFMQINRVSIGYEYGYTHDWF